MFVIQFESIQLRINFSSTSLAFYIRMFSVNTSQSLCFRRCLLNILTLKSEFVQSVLSNLVGTKQFVCGQLDRNLKVNQNVYLFNAFSYKNQYSNKAFFDVQECCTSMNLFLFYQWHDVTLFFNNKFSFLGSFFLT